MRSFFETTFGLAQDGKLQKGFETMLRYAVICHDFKAEIRVLQWAERCGVFLLWPLGKLWGYSSGYSGIRPSLSLPAADHDCRNILITASLQRYFHTLCRENIARPNGRLSHES